MAEPQKFHLTIMDADKMIFNDNVSHLFLQGDKGEYELLAYHYPVLGLLKSGNIFIDWKYYIEIRKGVVRFFKNECTILAELKGSRKMEK
jgi:F0F1-type ATP synthase epsilon subunit